MTITWTDTLDTIDWNELSDLYRKAPLGDKPPERLKMVFSNSMFRRFAYEDGVLVAAGRALADGADCSYICDIAILPSHQGRGLGRALIDQLVELSRGHAKIILYAVPGREGFYARHGFRRMTTAMAIFQDQEGAMARGYLARE
ncbi:GNAT family N-acetyltransferase [Massilia sp. TW-1]|uniref:GNAT family N-acetyltransferase n=1 Tax=Telluria antibiotica TaxID=2717319 RepID=A0ABX0PGD5_9BURK|nr:GNAT family N-acetyltransferase [Telluria antibiotica]NIA56100.1 GNAT family N-acetyltransferase [Telluria antibiotica]